jgi:hypothetical protein
MNNIYKITIGILTFLLSACSLDFEPTSAVSSNNLTEDDYSSLLVGVYDAMQMQLPSQIQDICSDNIKARTWSNLIQMDNDAVTTDNSYNSSYWDTYYGNIALCNNLINLISNKDGSKFREIEAQARVVRALNYYQIVSLWGDAPLVKSVSDSLLPRSPENDIWELMKEDAQYAIKYAPDFTDPSYVSKDAGKALLARILLIAPVGVQDKTEAKEIAEGLIAEEKFTLAENPADIWQNHTSAEIILQWMNVSGDGYAPGWWLRSNIVNNVSNPGIGDYGRYELPVDTALYNAFEKGDKRKAVSVRHLKNATNETYDVIKFPRYDGADPFPVFRIAEQYLISAEAQGYPKGIGRLNELRVIRGLPALKVGTDIDENNFEDKIMAERRVEFVSEGFRWYDLRRWWNSGEAGKQSVLNLNSYQVGEVVGSRSTASETLNIDTDGHNLLWPISATTRANDPNLTQNPGY